MQEISSRTPLVQAVQEAGHNLVRSQSLSFLVPYPSKHLCYCIISSLCINVNLNPSGQRSPLCISRHPGASAGAEESERATDDGGGEEGKAPAGGAQHPHLPHRGNQKNKSIKVRSVFLIAARIIKHQVYKYK